MTATLTSKGQVTIPNKIRKKANLTAGTRLEFEIKDEDTIVIHLITHDISELRVLVKRKRKKPVSLKKMKEAIRDGASESFR